MYGTPGPTLKAFSVNTLNDRVRILRKLVWKGQQAVDPRAQPIGGLGDPMMRRIGLLVTRACPARNDLCELGAVFDFVARNVRYTGDIAFKDTFQSALRTMQMHGGDCFPMAQKIICRSKSTGQYELVRLGELRFMWPHYEALSYNFHTMRQEFRPITAFQDKGLRAVMKARLSNGTDLVATPDHKFWTLDGQTAKYWKLKPRSLGEYAEMFKRDPKRRFEGTRILQAARIPALDLDGVTPAEAYLAGIYAAEGSSSARSKTSIAQSKPEIQARIENALAEVGVSARFQSWRGRKGSGSYYALRVGDGAELIDSLREQGTNSFNMQLPHRMLSGTRSIVEKLIEAHGDGDAYRPKAGSVWEKKVSAIYATSSDDLAEDLRLGLLVLGRSFYLQHQKNHQGVGKEPIWRLYEWKSPGMRKREEVLAETLPALRYGFVENVEDAGEETVGCITVEENHNLFLADGTLAFNCDDHATLGAVLAMENGFQTKFRITSNTGPTWDHIYLMAGVPKHAPTRWVALDTTLGRGRFGREPPRAKFKDFEVGEL